MIPNKLKINLIYVSITYIQLLKDVNATLALKQTSRKTNYVYLKISNIYFFITDYIWRLLKLVLYNIYDVKLLKYKDSEDYENKDDSLFLSSNHTSFILVDDGSDGQVGSEIDLRNRLESELRKSYRGRSIPFILIVIKGNHIIYRVS